MIKFEHKGIRVSFILSDSDNSDSPAFVLLSLTQLLYRHLIQTDMFLLPPGLFWSDHDNSQGGTENVALSQSNKKSSFLPLSLQVLYTIHHSGDDDILSESVEPQTWWLF